MIQISYVPLICDSTPMSCKEGGYFISGLLSSKQFFFFQVVIGYDIICFSNVPGDFLMEMTLFFFG
jgi:hypothetical protein